MGRHRTWTDDDLRAAVAAALTMAEVVAGLRLRKGGAAYVTVRTRMEQLGLRLASDQNSANKPSSPDRSATANENLGAHPSRRRWSDSDLAQAVARARSLHEVFATLNLRVGGSQWQVLRRRIIDLGLDTTHWVHPLKTDFKAQFKVIVDHLARQDLDAALRNHGTRRQVLISLGVPPTPRTYRAIEVAWARRGLDPAILASRNSRRRSRPLAEMLVADTDLNTSRLRERLVDEGVLPPRCSVCGITTWCDLPAPLQLDHIDGDRRNNVLVNLRIVCANCHAQTGTWAGRNRGRTQNSAR